MSFILIRNLNNLVVKSYKFNFIIFHHSKISYTIVNYSLGGTPESGGPMVGRTVALEEWRRRLLRPECYVIKPSKRKGS